MKEDLSQPFWVGYNNPRFPTARNGYLPALEPKPDPLPGSVKPPEPQWLKEQWRYVEQVRSQMIHQNKRLSELEKKSTKKLDTKPLIKPTYKDVTA